MAGREVPNTSLSSDAGGADQASDAFDREDRTEKLHTNITYFLDCEIQIQIFNKSVKTQKKKVFLSSKVLDEMVSLIGKDAPKSLESISTALNNSRMVKLASSNADGMKYDAGDGVTFRQVASQFNILCPHLVTQLDSACAGDVPKFQVVFCNTRFVNDFFYKNNRWNKVCEITLDPSNVQTSLSSNFRACEDPKDKPNHRAIPSPTKASKTDTSFKVSFELQFPDGFIVKCMRAPVGGSSKQAAHITSYSLIAKRIMRTCQPKMIGTNLQVDLSAFRELMGCIYVCFGEESHEPEQLEKKQCDFVNKIRQVSCVPDHLQPILSDVTWVLATYMNEIPEITFQFREVEFSDYNVTTKAAKEMAQHIDFVAALKASQAASDRSGSNIPAGETFASDTFLDKLCYFLARHMFLYGTSSSASTGRGNNGFNEVTEGVEKIVQVFKETIEKMNKPMFNELLDLFEKHTKARLTAQSACEQIASRMQQWNKLKQKFFDKHKDITDFWSKTVEMPFKMQMIQNKVDLGLLRHYLQLHLYGRSWKGVSGSSQGASSSPGGQNFRPASCSMPSLLDHEPLRRRKRQRGEGGGNEEGEGSLRDENKRQGGEGGTTTVG
eukprot:766661-Hanusia_phi.AAC.2